MWRVWEGPSDAGRHLREMSHVDMKEVTPGRGDGKCKGSEVSVALLGSRMSYEVRWPEPLILRVLDKLIQKSNKKRKFISPTLPPVPPSNPLPLSLNSITTIKKTK
jgi:hypothetical protein